MVCNEWFGGVSNLWVSTDGMTGRVVLGRGTKNSDTFRGQNHDRFGV